MINLNKLEAELKKITGHIISVSAKVSEKWSPSGFADVFIDADGDRVGICYSSDPSVAIKDLIKLTILNHSKEDTNEQKLQKFAEGVSKKTFAALLSAISCINKGVKIDDWAIKIINEEAAKLPVIEESV